MSEHIDLKEIVLAPHHMPTGNTRHYLGGNPIPPIAALRIAKFEGDSGYYLLYFGALGIELTDTYHATIDKAMEQAHWEFQVLPDEWQTITEEK